jgi:hypothetical protein
MGKFKFYCMPWLRVKERAWVKRIAALECEIDSFKDTVKTERTEYFRD